MAMTSLNIVAQTEDFECGMLESEYPYLEEGYSRSEDPWYLNNFEPVTFNIFYWGVAKDDGSWIGNELTLQKVNESIEALNEAFNPYKICFNLVGMDIIKKDTLHAGNTYFAITNYATANGHVKANAYNVYAPYTFCCYKGITGFTSTNIGIMSGAVNKPAFVHEMGHTLTLYHTFGTNNDRPDPVHCERVTRNPLHPEYNAGGLNAKGDKIHDTNAVPNFFREQHNHFAYALVHAGLFPGTNQGWRDARNLAFRQDGFYELPEAEAIEQALYFYGFLVEEVEHLKYNPALNHAYYDIPSATYMPDYRVADPASPFFKDCGGTPYQVTTTDLKNYMAYIKDENRQLFTIGQGIRMREAIELNLNIFSNVMIQKPFDLYIRDHEGDIAQEPNIHTDIFWDSPDIWVRNQNDGFSNQTHQNPEYSPTNPNYVYVRIHNNSCQASSGSDILKVYWAKTTTSLFWPNNWDGSWVINGVTMGNQIPPLSIPVIPVIEPGDEAILVIPWMVPNPEDFTDIPLNAYSKWHFSLLARIVSVNDPMTITEDIYTTDNVENNNNIAWKGTTVVDLFDSLFSPFGATVGVHNPSNQTKSYNLKFFKDPGEAGKPIYEEAEAAVTLDSTLFAAWSAGGNLGSNYTSPTLAGNKLVASGDNMVLSNIILQPYQYTTMYVTFNFLIAELTSKDHFVYHAVQEDYSTEQVYGGETFVINKQQRSTFSAFAGDDQLIEMNDEITIYAESINEDAVYNWYDPEGNLIYTGSDLTLSPTITQTYKLEIIAETDGYKDYDEVTVNISPYQMESLTPNPASNQVTVNYYAEGATSAYLMFVNQVTSDTDNYILDTAESSVVIDLSNYTSGLYSVILVCDGDIYSSKNLAKQ